MKRGKKKKPTHSSWSVQRKTIGKWNSLSILKMGDLNPSTTCLTRSQVEVAFVIFTFQILLFISTYIRKPWVLSSCERKVRWRGYYYYYIIENG